MNADSPLVVKDETIDRTEWTPSSNRMDAYRAREVEMCVAAIRNRDLTFRQDHTLFSFKTWEAAKKEVLQNAV